MRFLTHEHTFEPMLDRNAFVPYLETREESRNTTSHRANLSELLYHELRSIAHRHLMKAGARRDGNATLETTALVHEAYLKLSMHGGADWRDEAHFRALASVAMRQILIDRARSRATHKHGAGLTRVPLEEAAIESDDSPDALLAIDAALDQLTHLSPRLGQLVQLRFYGGLSEVECAAEFGVSVRTIQRDWMKSRMLLERLLTG